MAITHEHVASCSEAGVRPANEDRCGFLIAADGLACILVLADGMGGHACGEVASELAVSTVLRAFEKYGFAESEALLHEAIQGAHDRIRREAASDPAREGMGTTLVAAVVDDAGILVAHVGDSRALQFRPPNVRRLTRDHLYVTDVLGVDEQAARAHPQGHVLSQALGADGGIEPTFTRFDLEAGDRIVLCSDGVHGVVAEPEMGCIASAGPVADAVARLVAAALANDSRDNCTAVLFEAPARDS